ncbi:hypothetical protein JM16_004765 [Phytophthora kernoviae]|uniref:[F-actin]-monooxygenase MICAL1-3-like Rossman domain-containing protein n=1 Tax=Phytophthora kernoviae TaxID=325452 RepID=A0A8T0M0Z9_9STRA|nr:hypothetical protein JM16_004765 [Phytophthora kernoviae]
MLEIALLGGQVVLLEKRALFSRENMLHLWPWVVQDLTSLGAKVLFSQFSKSMPPTSDDKEKPFYTITTQPQIPIMEFTAVLSASGTNDKLAEHAGISRFVFCRKEALGIVCYFPNLGTAEEAKVKEFSWTSQPKHQILDKLREVGIDIENIVYYRGEMHYLVMTPKRQNLVERQVVNENLADSTDLVLDENVNSSALHEYVKAIVDFVGIPRKTEFTRVSLFDFSSRSRADKAANILTSYGKKLYVGLIGDSLLEPLWHEDVGTCRGFLGAMDAVWMISQIGEQSDEQLLADRDNVYLNSMEEDEETYGFGSFSDLFGAAPAAAKRLDVGALSRFCMLERLLSRFQQQQRRDKPSVLYQHVAAKFDGVSIDGGLGALSFTSLEGGGVVWQQTAASDSDALERRKKELQDITNQPQNDVKSIL